MALERVAVGVGVELLGAASQQLSHGRKLEDQPCLGFGVGPVGVVEHANPRAERCQQLDLNVVGPPAAAQPKPVTAVQVSGLRVELLKPAPALLTLAPAPAGQRLRILQEVRARG